MLVRPGIRRSGCRDPPEELARQTGACTGVSSGVRVACVLNTIRTRKTELAADLVLALALLYFLKTLVKEK